VHLSRTPRPRCCQLLTRALPVLSVLLTRRLGAGSCLLVFVCAEAAGVAPQGQVRVHTGADTKQ
jgi:hypothetical protein